LHRIRTVEPPFGAHPVEILGAGARFGHQADRVARQPHHREDGQAQNEQRDQRIERAPDDEPDHRRA
jgi:hypothetical protein